MADLPSFRGLPIMDGVMKRSPVEFAALFDGLDWTRVQTVRGIPKPTVAVSYSPCDGVPAHRPADPA